MTKAIIFFARTVFLSVSSYLWKLVHLLYENSFSVKRNIGGEIKILVVQLGQIGDFVLSTPLFQALKNFYREKLKLTLMINPINAKLAENDYCVSNIVFYKSPKYSRYKLARYLSGGPEKIKFPLPTTKDSSYDQVIWLRGDLRTFLWVVKNRIPLKSITRYPNPLRWAWLPLITRRFMRRKFKHFIESLDKLYEGIEPRRFTWPVIKNAHPSTIQNNQKVIFIHISAGNELRRWPKERFAEVCKLLLSLNKEVTIHLIGSAADYESAEAVRNHHNLTTYLERIINNCGNVAINELAPLFAGGTLYIGFDSGPLHIAASAGIPIVAMMGPQSPQIFRPWGSQKIKIIYKDFFCSPCWQFSCLFNESGAGACILAIQPDEVFREAKHILQKG